MPASERTGEQIVALIRQCAIKRPDLIDELFPGCRLVKKRMTPAERTQLANKASAVASKAAALERHDRIMPIIQRILADNPTASLAEIKTVLDNSGVTPLRSAKWSRASINFIMTKAGLRAKDQS
ncbi:hypothetical protein [Pararhizobium qamdonense]|uniref:hypothetical protein n=1 Tax=Pararhizobium qamdonense TaxID=3031126 RepID=UPI0023E3393C|nr:hypothetical protein [Pararhizobium qamdonense]